MSDDVTPALDAQILALSPEHARAALLVLARMRADEVCGVLDGLEELNGGER